MSFIEDYMLMIKGTKPAYEYHVWAMLSTLSTFAGRRVWFPFGPKRYYPHLYVCLVGDPGVAKSSAMERSMDVVRATKVTPISGTRITKEALLKRMSSDKFDGRKYFPFMGEQVEYNQYAIYATEFVDFLGADAQGFLDFLTAAWDQSVIDNETKHQGQDVIVGPYITLLACMTPEKLKGYMKLSILTGGFARRCAFVFSSKRNIVHWPSFTDDQMQAMGRCIERGVRLQTVSGPFTVTDLCRTYYEEWNQKNEETVLDKPPQLRGWFESKGEMLWKLSMLISLSEGDNLVIDIPHYRIAQKFCELLEANLARVFEGAGINPSAGAASQVVRMLEALGRPMLRKKVEAMFYDQVPSLRELQDMLTHLVSVGRLKERTLTRAGQLFGTAIGTPEAIDQYSDAQLVALLLPVAGPAVASNMGSQSLTDPNFVPVIRLAGLDEKVADQGT